MVLLTRAVRLRLAVLLTRTVLHQPVIRAVRYHAVTQAVLHQPVTRAVLLLPATPAVPHHAVTRAVLHRAVQFQPAKAALLTRAVLLLPVKAVTQPAAKAAMKTHAKSQS
jgi:hypothetical protein